VKRIAFVALLSLSMMSPSIAGLVPTPPAGTGMPVSQPAPNPLQYNAVSGTVISSSQFNSNFWKSYNDINAIASALNTCTYSSGTGVTAVSATAPIVGTISACAPGSGTTLTLSLASGVSYSGTYFTASNSGYAYRWPGTGTVGGHTMALDDDSTGNVSGVSCSAYRFVDATAALQFACGDGFGNFGVLGTLYSTGLTSSGPVATTTTIQGNTVNAKPSGTAYTVPWDANSVSGNATAHVEHQESFASGALSGNTCAIGTASYQQPFSTSDVFVSLQVYGSLSSPDFTTHVSPTNSSTFGYEICNVVAGSSSQAWSLSYFAFGE
jgi:hypothetical protein